MADRVAEVTSVACDIVRESGLTPILKAGRTRVVIDMRGADAKRAKRQFVFDQQGMVDFEVQGETRQVRCVPAYTRVVLA